MSDASRGCPGVQHEYRVDTLECLAGLLGCRERIGRRFPSGEEPDVLRVSLVRRMLFVGEAKDSEPPGSTATQVRLQRYLRWCSPWAQRGTCVFALCFGDPSQRGHWPQVILRLVREAEMEAPATWLTDVGGNCFVASFTWSGPAAHQRATGPRP